MYQTRQLKPKKTSIKVNNGYIGETIEKKVRRITNNKEPITDSAPLVYTDRKEGVMPDYNIRTDRFDMAIDGMDRVAGMRKDKREGKRDEKGKLIVMEPKQGETGGQSADGK